MAEAADVPRSTLVMPPDPEAAAHPIASLPPDLGARLEQVREEETRRRLFRARTLRERRALLVLLGFVLFLLPNFRMARVVGRSMQPQFEPGDTILVWKTWRLFSPLKPGDIIVFRHRGEEIVKRVVFVQNPQGTADWPEPNYVPSSLGDMRAPSGAFPDYGRRVDRRPSEPGYPQRSVYVIGDNFGLSDDSRRFGPIAPESILGKVLTR